ncbi:zinc-binding dehydrogenase [Streptomyces fulvorobeus]|uniref:NADPH2:quinone reductase n=1 Tax=Streptomyces fulvorobeus TaxID=284028 RepID=A0A7J0CG13_9ACTN|nr:zinc-binding dehydrogenase [Streptomyces fulvorobeus]NYE44651.1 NADPH2:quinone reductase [Streptomyces fulvorobeus]GFN01198.1 quinone oxidoreductase [Streptomyces fulvorobeus]
MAKIIRIHEHGEPSVLRVETAEVAEPGPGEVKIRQEAVGVNFFDTMLRDGRVNGPLPMVLGSEGSGVVEAVGPGVADIHVGERVAYFASMGAYASERLIDASSLVALPQDISNEQAAAFLAKGLTAWMGLRALHDIAPGEVVLVAGASGNVGSILSRWAMALGATVIGVAGSRGKLDKVRAGAHHAFHSQDPEALTKIRAVAPEGVDVVFDFVGHGTAELTAAAVRSGGKIVAIGAASGQLQTDALEVTRRGIEVVSGGVQDHVNTATVGEASGQLFQAMRDGLFHDLRVSRYAFTDVSRAHADVAARRLTGLPVLRV